MRKPFIYAVVILAAIAIIKDRWQDSAKEDVSIKEDVTITEGNELYIEAGDLDLYFKLLEPFSETYMLFGADHVTHKAAFNEFWLSVISMENVRPIYAEHPDFYMCASPGAAKAKKAVQTMNIIAADSEVLQALNEAVSEFNNRIGRGGDRLALILEGVKLEMTAAIARNADQDMLNRLPIQSRSNYFLVESVEMVDAMTAIEGS